LEFQQRAFAQYEQAFKPVVRQEQKKVGATARFLVPATPVGLWVKTHLFPLLVPPMLGAIERGSRLLPMFSSRPNRLKGDPRNKSNIYFHRQRSSIKVIEGQYRL
jgi:hypothetical protein